jgi:hypothetical protein
MPPAHGMLTTETLLLVVPAKVGIQDSNRSSLGPRLRGDDEFGLPSPV